MSSPGYQQRNGKPEAPVKFLNLCCSEKLLNIRTNGWHCLSYETHSSKPVRVLFGRETHSVIPMRSFQCCNFDHSRCKRRRTALKHAYDKHVRLLASLHVQYISHKIGLLTGYQA